MKRVFDSLMEFLSMLPPWVERLRIFTKLGLCGTGVLTLYHYCKCYIDRGLPKPVDPALYAAATCILVIFGVVLASWESQTLSRGRPVTGSQSPPPSRGPAPEDSFEDDPLSE